MKAKHHKKVLPQARKVSIRPNSNLRLTNDHGLSLKLAKVCAQRNDVSSGNNKDDINDNAPQTKIEFDKPCWDWIKFSICLFNVWSISVATKRARKTSRKPGLNVFLNWTSAVGDTTKNHSLVRKSSQRKAHEKYFEKVVTNFFRPINLFLRD